ncbi:outer membrane lipoprotein-sorting protein [Rubellicoccus peritrichatus]|uniref:Outer membrane lipoprotein-sorting protein n=1 Tax=Rubellicoccus peritrichatus TaxID=3080537 RepID=A0AAQ3LGC9_9BACT|nr:outer membrane lipoprotein-sorting protein [Puniceicoccus sp. CR14]WOO43375.1 outer membrane lipoprotein-sorting protein [Puniceicoccus sp. CR14]
MFSKNPDLFDCAPVLIAMRNLRFGIQVATMVTAWACLLPFHANGQGPSKQRPTVPKVDQIDQEEGAKLIEKFRLQRLRGDYVFHFDLENIPRRGKKSIYEGIIWGTWNDKGPLSRAIIWSPGKPNEPLMQIIAQGGAKPEVWLWEPGKDVRALEPKEFFEPLLPNNHYSAFDLLMPFVFWDKYQYEGSKRVKGRPAHQFVMWPSDSIREARPDLGAAFIALDANYNALVKAELLDESGDEIQTIEVQSFKEVDDQYIIKQIDLLEEVTRDKSRFIVRGAAVNQKLDPKTFDPKQIKSIPDTRKIPFKGV